MHRRQRKTAPEYRRHNFVKITVVQRYNDIPAVSGNGGVDHSGELCNAPAPVNDITSRRRIQSHFLRRKALRLTGNGTVRYIKTLKFEQFSLFHNNNAIDHIFKFTQNMG